MNFSKTTEEIRDLIAENNLKEAINLLRKLLKSDKKLDDAIIQSATFNDIRKKIRHGTISDDLASQTMNQIRSQVLEILSEINDFDTANTKVIPQPEEKKRTDEKSFISSRLNTSCLVWIVLFTLFCLLLGALFMVYDKTQDNKFKTQENRFLRLEKSNLEAQLALVESQKQQFENEKELYRESLAEIQKSIENMSETYSEKEKNALLSQIQNKEDLILQLQNEYKDEIDKLKQDFVKTSKELSESKNINEELRIQNEELHSAIEELNLKYDSIYIELKTKDTKLAELKESAEIKPLQVTLKIKPYSNGWVDVDTKLKKSTKASNITQVRVEFSLDRSIRANDNLYVRLKNKSWEGIQVVDKNLIKNGKVGHVDFVIGKKRLSEGVIVVDFFNYNDMIENKVLQVE